MTRILICDDSRAFAAGLKRFLEHDGDLRVVARAVGAEQAVAEVQRVRPDLVKMDIEMPGLDGIEATRRILALRPVPIIVISGHTPRGSERAAAALAAGAVDVISKAAVRLETIDSPAAVLLRQRIRRLARPPGQRSGPRAAPGRGGVPTAPAPVAHATVVAIAASTGGPQALLQILSALPGGYGIPVLVVQHMTPGFTGGLASWLDQQVAVPVALAAEGERLGPGVWFAPEGAHLRIDPLMRAALDPGSGAELYRPAADILLRSAAEVAGGGAVGVVLTGMGRDGAAGIAAVRAAGGLTVAQDEASSVVWGMPGAAIEQGAELVLPPAEIGALLGGLVPAARRR
jgi:two-component system chemotaxis response regulator CheB